MNDASNKSRKAEKKDTTRLWHPFLHGIIPHKNIAYGVKFKC